MATLTIDDNDLKSLCEAKDILQLTNTLKNILIKNENSYDFTMFDEKKLATIWEAVFKIIENDELSEIHLLCLKVLKILCRDKENLNKIICEKYTKKLIEKAEYIFKQSKNVLNLEIIAESVKCLCNVAFISESGRDTCANKSVVESLVNRLSTFKDLSYRNNVMLYDVKLLFILTIMREHIKKYVANELKGIDCLSDCLFDLVALPSKNSVDVTNLATYTIEDLEQSIACEILKTQFNLFTLANSEENKAENNNTIANLTKILLILLYAEPSSEAKLMELRSNIVHLLTVIPHEVYINLTPAEEGTSEVHYMGHNMYALQAILQFLEHQIKITTFKEQYGHLSPVLMVLTKASSHTRIHRKYLRGVVLPPLRDVSAPPERGNTLRNSLCRLLTTPITPVRDLVAGFLFVLCKEKVSRMVKYTGFGNAAGHLAQKGLLGSSRERAYSSSSDSDTEEYLEAQPRIDPVVGCTRPPRADPFEGMTEEQKEYEAMKLVNMFDKLVSGGIVRPARLGPDGRPEPVDHVLQLQETTKQDFK